MKKNTFGMPTLIENDTLKKNIALCRRLGLDFIELNMNFPEYQLDALKDTERLNKLAEDSDISFTIHLDERLDPADFNPVVRQAYLETVCRVIDTANAIHAPIINMHMNPGIYITLPDRKVWMYSRDLEIYMRNIIEFKALCGSMLNGSDTIISIENTDGFADFEARAIDELLTLKNFALTWDIGHSKAAKEIDLPFINKRIDRLKHMHVHDGTEKSAKNHLALGDGEIDLISRLETASEHDCRCVLETKTIAALEKSVTWLKEHGFYE